MSDWWALGPAACWGVWFFREFTSTFHALKPRIPSPGVCQRIPVPAASDPGIHVATRWHC